MTDADRVRAFVALLRRRAELNRDLARGDDLYADALEAALVDPADAEPKARAAAAHLHAVSAGFDALGVECDRLGIDLQKGLN